MLYLPLDRMQNSLKRSTEDGNIMQVPANNSGAAPGAEAAAQQYGNWRERLQTGAQ